MQVLEDIQIAWFLVDLAQPLNHQLAVLDVVPLYILYNHYNYYVIPVYMIKEDIISRVYNDLSGFGSLKQTLQDTREVNPSIKLDYVINIWTNTPRGNSSSKGRTAS